MSGHEGDEGAMVAMGERYSGEGWSCDRRGDSRDYFKLDLSGRQRRGLFPASSEDEWISALETHDALARARTLDQNGVDLLLSQAGFRTVSLRNANGFRKRRCKSQQFLTD